MLGPWAYESPAVVTEHVLTGPLARYRYGSHDELGSKVVLLKLCVSNALAGSIIGHGGLNLDQLQLISGGARIQLSRPNELYPGTSDRVLVLTGTLGPCLTALFAISGFLRMPVPPPFEVYFIGIGTQWKLILPSNVCGYILGAGGNTLRAITAQADANISISPEPERDADVPNERIATITGGCSQTLHALGLIIDKLLMRPYMEPAVSPFEGHFPSSRLAVQAKTGPLRDPPGLLQKHMIQHMPQQHPQHPFPQQQHPQQLQHPQALVRAPGQPLYAQPPSASTFVYFPLQPAPAPVLPLAAPVSIPNHLALSVAAHPPPPAGAMRALPRMPSLPIAAAPLPQMAAAVHAGPPQGPPPPPPDQQARPDVMGPRHDVSIQVPDNRVGILIGHRGKEVQRLQRQFLVNIFIGRRQQAPGGAAGEGAPPDAMRRVTISGPPNGVSRAHAFILKRLAGSRGTWGAADA